MNDLAIRIDSLTKQVGTRLILDRVSLSVPRGTILGLVGPNGSGKTTLMRCALGLVRPTSGTICLLGRDQPAGRAEVIGKVSAIIERPAYYPHLTGIENMWVMGRTSDISDSQLSGLVPRLLDEVGLPRDAQRRPMHHFSEGERQRWGLAAALLTGPDLLLLDEPTNGLDPVGRDELLRTLDAAHRRGMTILLSSHLLDEIREVCTHLAVMSRGQVVWHGTMNELPRGSIEVLYYGQFQRGRIANMLATEEASR